MDTTDENCSLLAVPNGAYPVHCTEEVLLPFFSDESLPAAMAPHLPPALPELRLVLLGRKGAGKSAAGNTLLGGVGGFESGRPTEECVKRRADVAGRRVTVVDTPGWEWYYPLNRTPNWVRRETLRSVSLCPPGPHAVLLVVRSCASVTDAYIQEMEEHLEPLGSEVWEHTMLLFTRGDELGRTTMEQRILTSGPALQRLLQKCGNRYHVVNNLRRADGTQQVQELMRKLEQMVEEKTDGSSHLEMDSSVLLGLEADGKRRARERRKKQRQMEAQMQRGTIKAALMSDGPQGSELDAHHSFSKAPRRLQEVRLLLLGERETGKSSAGNTILGQTGFFQAGGVTEECVRRQAEVAKRLVTVVDTPGWEAGVAGATPERTRREIINGVALCPPGPHALLLTLRVDTLVSAGHVREHLELLGEGVWRHTILLFTHGDQLREGLDFEQHIQGGGRDLQWLMEKCRGRYHVISSADGGGRGSGGCTTVTELLEKVEKMATMNRCEAFSSLVQDVRDLSQQRNEKVNQRLKEIGDKMLRQEAELKNVREREIKSIRWFFDWKRKGKSPGKANVQREEEEEEEDRRMDERKQDFGELEERMRWLTEDKEREVQDLSVENERIRVALNQSGRERDEATLNLELREIEVEELTERIDEQQAKLLDLERAGVDSEQERKRREDAIRAKEQEWRKKLEETVERHKREEAEWTEQVQSFKSEMDETKRHCDNVLERKEREVTKLEEKLKREMEVKLFERDKEEEELRKRAAEEKRFTLDTATLQQQEMTEKISEIEAKHQEQIHQSVKEKADDMEKVRQQHENETRDMNEETRREIENLKKHFSKENEEHVKAKEQEIAELEQKYQKQIRETLRENEKERETINSNHMKDLTQKIQEKDREMEDLKRQHQEEINQMEKLMEATREEQQREMERKVKEKEEDVERVQQQCEEKIRDMDEERKRANEEQREKFAKESEKQMQERERQIRELQLKCSAQREEREIVNQENEKCLLEKLQERDELKLQHSSQVEEKVRESEKENERFEKEMEKRVEEKEKEIEEMKLNVGELTTKLQQEKEKEMDYSNYKKEIEQIMREKEKEMEAMKLNVNEMKEKLQQGEEKETSYKKELEERLEEKDREVEGMREHSKRTEEKRERDRLKQKRQMMQKLEENERVIEKLNEHIKDIEEIVQRKDEEAEQRLQDRGRRTEEMKLQLLNEMERKLKEKETEIESMRQEAESRKTRWREEQETRDKEMKKLMEILEKKTEEITETQSLLAQRHREVEEVMEKLQEKEEALERLRRKDGGNEKELVQLKLTIEQTKSELKNLTGKMEEEMMSLIQEYEKEIARRDESIESISKDKEEESQRNEELQEQSEKMRKEADNFKFKFEELRREKEEEVRKHQRGYEEIQSILKERDLEVRALTGASEKLQTDMELREQFERQMVERESEWRMKEEEMEEKLLKREREVEERGEDTRRKEDELSKRRLELCTKEEELRKLEVNLEMHRTERDEYERGVKLRTQTIERKEREIETLLRALEVKQQELSSHGQDLQKSVKRLKDQGKELKDREHHLNKEEQELIRWKSELQTQNQHVDSTAQQLSEMGRDLALLKEELHRKETNLKTALKKWSKWEVELEAREAELNERNFEGGQGPEAAVESSENNVFVMCREVSERRSKGREAAQGESTKEREDQTMKTAQSAAESENCHHETLEETETSEEKEGMRGRGGEMGEERGLERKQVVQDQRSLSPSSTASPGLHLRVLVLGESWSSRCPAGVTILGGEDLKPDGSTFRSWRGQTAGRRLAVAEPLGLRWRDGPNPTNPKKSLLDGVSWCRPGPQVVLLLMPVFLACTRKYRRAVEEDMGSLGDEIWQRTMVVFTWGETLGVSAEQHILRSGELTGLVEKCGGRFHVLSSKRRNPETEGLFEKMEDIVASNSRGRCLV